MSRRGPEGNSKAAIVLVHGAWHGAWCWENNFLSYFPDCGWDTHAVSLRGHGGSEGASGLRCTSIADYVADLSRVVSSLDRPPILIGHSMGGHVVQKFLESHSAAGAVLMASVPPSGILKFNLRIIRRHPLTWLAANLFMQPYRIVGKPELAREWFFSPEIPEADLLAHFSRLQSESYRAVWDMLALDLPKPGKVSSPIAVLGGGKDQIFSVPEILGTAAAYGVEAKIFPDMPHNMMSEPGWPAVAEWILQWVASISAGRGPPIAPAAT